MKILHVINTLNVAGAERLLTDMLPLQQAMGHQVELVVLNGILTPFFEILENRGVRVHAFRQRGGEYNPIVVWKLHRFLNNYDIVHAHLFPTQYWVAACKWLFGVKTPLVTTEHSTSNTRFKYWLTTQTDRWVYRRYNCIVGISDAVSKVMDNRVRGQVPTLTIQNGVDLNRFSQVSPMSRQELDIPDDARILIQVARFQEAKNQDCLIRALVLLPAHVHAVFAGDGERMDSCKRLAQELHVQDRTHFLGIRDDVPRLYSLADVVVVSSHWEGFGLAAVEGMAAGLPVVSSRVDGLKEIVSKDELLFDDDDDQLLASRIRHLLENKDFYQEMSAYCRQRSKLYSIDSMVAEYVALYERIVAQTQ